MNELIIYEDVVFLIDLLELKINYINYQNFGSYEFFI